MERGLHGSDLPERRLGRVCLIPGGMGVLASYWSTSQTNSICDNPPISADELTVLVVDAGADAVVSPGSRTPSASGIRGNRRRRSTLPNTRCATRCFSGTLARSFSTWRFIMARAILRPGRGPYNAGWLALRPRFGLVGFPIGRIEQILNLVDSPTGVTITNLDESPSIGRRE